MASDRSDWKVLPLPDVIDFQEGPGIMARDFRGDGTPLIRLAGLTGGSLLEGCNHLDPGMVAKKWSHFALLEGDTLLSTSASLGRTARVSHEGVGAIAYTGIIRMRPRTPEVRSEYVRRLLQDPRFQRQADAMGAGSVMKHFGPSHLRQMTVVVPPRDEQGRIDSVLTALEEKIESNQRLVALLEEVATTMFRARFVGLAGGATLGDEELGTLPKGWDRATLGSIADLEKGQTKPFERPEDLFEHFSIPAFDDGRRPEVIAGTEMLSGKSPVPSTACVLLSKLNPGSKRVWRPRPSGQGEAVCSPEFLVLKPRREIPAAYLWGVLEADDSFYGRLLGYATGTTGSRQRVRPSEALSVAIDLPSMSEILAYSAVAEPLLSTADSLLAESWTLSDIREALLPRLLSGEIRVQSPEGASEAA